MALEVEHIAKPILGQCKLHFDLTDIISKRQNDGYKTGEKVTSDKFKVGEYNVTFSMYPKGMNDESKEHWPVFLKLSQKAENASVEFTIHCDGDENYKMKLEGPVQIFKQGRGWPKAFTSLEVINSKSFIVEITIFDEESQSQHPYNYTKPYSKQQELFYENSKKNGDVTLIIQEEQIDVETEPKRKEHTNNVNIGDNDTEMKVSSLALMSASHVFAGMFNHEFKENNDKKITIQAINKKDVDDMYFYIVTNQLRDNVNPITLIKLAHLYDLTSLFRACANKIITELSIDNYISSANTFNRYSIESQYDKIIEFGKKNLKEIEKKDNFQDLSFAFKFGVLGYKSK